VLAQPGQHLGVVLDHLVDRLGMHALLHVHRGRGDEAAQLDVVGIKQQPHEGLGVVGLVLDVGEDDEARLCGAPPPPPDSMSAPSMAVNASLSIDGVVMGQRSEGAWACSQRSGVTRNVITPCGATLPP
jgi:hypothetical protein